MAGVSSMRRPNAARTSCSPCWTPIAGARVLGELGIGLNYGIQRFTKSILFDEKMGGTVHLALGAAIPGNEGKNTSAIHWDMLKDLRQQGELRADGRTIQKDGKFLVF